MATTSSGAITTTTSLSGKQRITSLTSGIDVDSIIKASMTAEKAKLNKLKQQQQLTTWKQEEYRKVISEVKAFSDKYFDLTSSSSMLSQSNYQQFKVTGGSEVVSVVAGATAVKGTHTIEISQLATAASRSSSGRLTEDIQGTTSADFTAAQGKSFLIELDGTQRTVTIDLSVTDIQSFQTAIDDAVGEGKVAVGTNTETGALTIKAVEDSGVNMITISNPSSDGAMSALGFGSGSTRSNRINGSDTLETIAAKMNTPFTFNEDGQIELEINGTSFTFDKSETLNDMISEINQSTAAGVTFSYDQLTDEFQLSADQTGAGSTLEISEVGSTFLSSVLSQSTGGQDAKLVLDGQNLTRSSNQVTVNGVTYNLTGTTDEKEMIKIEQDADAVYNNISNFVTDYNALISNINTKISEDYDRDYQPLTNDQKAEMSTEEIANWETKAKTGILANDSTMQKMLYNLRDAVIESVSGESLSMYKIGISTSGYSEKGQLHIDESTLKKAIQENPNGVMNLFTQQSSSYSGTTAVRTLNASQREARTKEEGIAYRFYDVLQDNISTLMDSNGNKGLMLEKAGMKNDMTESDNVFSAELKKISTQISNEEDRLEEVEDRLYTKYSALETYITKMNSQLDTLMNSFSSGS